MFSKLRKFGSSLLHKPLYSFAPKKSPKQRMRTQYESPDKLAKSKQQSYLHIGIYGLVFACCFAALPLYRTFCEHMGLIGNNDKKTYEFKDKKIVNLKKYAVKFSGQAQPEIAWEFEPVEREVIVGTSETAIVFYRLRNREERPIVGFSTYNIYPQQANLYFSKIQCFCFNQQMINPQQQLLLPLFFYLQPQLNEDPDVGRISEISVNYQFHQSNNQDLAKFAAEEVRRIEENKRKLVEIRAKKRNMSVEDYEELVDGGQGESEEDGPVVIGKEANDKMAEVRKSRKNLLPQ